MLSSTEQSGYKFTDRDLSTIHSHFARIQNSLGVTLDVTLGTAKGLAGLVVSINFAEPIMTVKVLQVQSWREPGAAAVFAVMSEPDGAPFGPSAFYDSLAEALIYAEIHLKRTVESITNSVGSNTSAAPRSAESSETNTIASTVLTPAEVQYVQTYARELGEGCGLPGFAEFVEARIGVMSIAIGVVCKETRVNLGTVVVSNTTSNSCSVRDFQNNPMPGPEYYSTIYTALVSTRQSFDKLAELAARGDVSDGSKPKKTTTITTRIASAVGIIAMFVVFGVIFSLLGFIAYFASRSRIGTGKAVGLAIAVALVSRIIFEIAVK